MQRLEAETLRRERVRVHNEEQRRLRDEAQEHAVSLFRPGTAAPPCSPERMSDDDDAYGGMPPTRCMGRGRSPANVVALYKEGADGDEDAEENMHKVSDTAAKGCPPLPVSISSKADSNGHGHGNGRPCHLSLHKAVRHTKGPVDGGVGDTGSLAVPVSLAALRPDGKFVHRRPLGTQDLIISDIQQCAHSRLRSSSHFASYVWRANSLTPTVAHDASTVSGGWHEPAAWEPLRDELRAKIDPRLHGSFNVVEQQLSVGPWSEAQGRGYAVRVTKSPHQLSETNRQALSSQAWCQVAWKHTLQESLNSLDAAARGIGPEVYALVLWPAGTCDSKGHVFTEPVMLMVTQMYSVGFAVGKYLASRLDAYKLNVQVSMIAHSLCEHCLTIAEAGLVAWDVNPSNWLRDTRYDLESAQACYLIDFAPDLLRSHPGTSVRTRGFVNLLLLSMHTLVYTHARFAVSFLANTVTILNELAQWSDDDKEHHQAASELWDIFSTTICSHYFKRDISKMNSRSFARVGLLFDDDGNMLDPIGLVRALSDVAVHGLDSGMS